MAGSASPRNNYFVHVIIVVTFFLVVRGGGAAQNYKDALQKAIIFFDGQRSGNITREYQQGNTWRGDSALNDGREANNTDLTGGYYDAGDNEKFNFPMAFTTTMLSWSVIEFGEKMGDQLPYARGAIRWGTDYLLKCASDLSKSGVLYVGVGDGDVDHKCWERPEDIDKDLSGGAQWRTVYSVSPSRPGSEVAAETAAALAAASIVFKDHDRSYSRRLLKTAKLVFDFANKYPGQYSNQFYPDCSEFKDELIWGAAWLLKATTNSDTYTNVINGLGDFNPPKMASWDNKYAAASVLLSRNFFSKTDNDSRAQVYSKKAEFFFCSIMDDPTLYTKGGLMYLNLGGTNLQYVTAITSLMVTYAKYMDEASHYTFNCTSNINSKTLRTKAQTQVDYILGENPLGKSYMVGYGSKYPKNIHHRASSIPSINDHPNPIGCNFSFLYSTSDNPNKLIGAVVGGPDGDDQFLDDRTKVEQSEPATYINAPFVGTLAYLAGNI